MTIVFGTVSVTPEDTVHVTGVAGVGNHGSSGSASLSSLTVVESGVNAVGVNFRNSPLVVPTRTPSAAVTLDSDKYAVTLGLLQAFWAWRRFAALGCVVHSQMDAATATSPIAFPSYTISGFIPLSASLYMGIGTYTYINGTGTIRAFSLYDLAARTVTSVTYKSITMNSNLYYFLASTGSIVLPTKRKVLIFPGYTSGSAIPATAMYAFTYDFGTGSLTDLGWSALVSQGVTMPNGRIFLVPVWNDPLIYDPDTNAVNTPFGNYGATGTGMIGNYWGGCLMPDGRVFICPHTSTKARIYDPVSNTTTTPTPVFPGASAFRGCVTMLDGRIFMVPCQSTTACIYDPVTDTVSTPQGVYPGNYAYSGGLILPDGRVFCIPMNSVVRIYDPNTGELSSIPFSKIGSGLTTLGQYISGTNNTGNYYLSSYGASVLPNGRVICCGNGSVSILNCGGWGCFRPPGLIHTNDLIGYNGTT